MSDARTPENAGQPPRWQAADAALLDWGSWEDGCALFHRPSGKTHFVNGESARLLTDVLREPMGLDQIVEALWGELPREDLDALRAETSDLLLYLTNLGLVRSL